MGLASPMIGAVDVGAVVVMVGVIAILPRPTLGVLEVIETGVGAEATMLGIPG